MIFVRKIQKEQGSYVAFSVFTIEAANGNVSWAHCPLDLYYTLICTVFRPGPDLGIGTGGGNAPLNDLTAPPNMMPCKNHTFQIRKKLLEFYEKND